MARRLLFTVRNSTIALAVLSVTVLFVFTSCVQNANVSEEESQTIENALGMKFVPIKMTLPGKPSEVVSMQQAEITYEQYRKFKVAVGLATTEAERTPSDQPLAPQDFDCWDDASQFIDRLNQWDTKHAYRMPTGREWEFACTGKVGGQPITRTCCEDSANFLTRQSKPNPFGLHDMLGVYGEYCSDGFYDTNDPALAHVRVVRGMPQETNNPPCFRFSSDHRLRAPGCQTDPYLVIGVRLVLQPRK